MTWLDKQVSFYSTHADNIGRPATLREILLCPNEIDIQIIIELRRLDRNDSEYDRLKKELKALLQCFTPASLLASKAKGELSEIYRSGLMQLDFDYADIAEYNLEELKRCVFSLPFIGFCGKSCSGDGFYALGRIAEPERLNDYAEHCFSILQSYGIKADTSKGKKPENLRYVSYDSNMLIRDQPEPLLIKKFSKDKQSKKGMEIKGQQTSTIKWDTTKSRLIESMVRRIENVQKGNRWQTVQQVAYTLGGIQDDSLLDVITNAIDVNAEFSGEEGKYKECAKYCFGEGQKSPLPEKSTI